MTWPTLQEYNEAIQNPQTAFDDLELRSGRPELDPLGLPRVRTGQYACVYKMHCTQRIWAVRCFSQAISDQQERYKIIDQYISPLRGLPYIVGFDYLAKGILARGQWYPILRMEWIQGELLSEYIEHNLGNPLALRQLAFRWAEMIRALRSNSIAHGDLQHGNVLVLNNTLKLVDYDGMYVPALAGKTSHEIGHRNYQHPARTETEFGPDLDNFSAWVIYISLVALSIDTSLWAKAKGGDECLLFRKSDFEQPLLSPTIALLAAHRDTTIQTLATLFRSVMFHPPSHVPSLDQDGLDVVKTVTSSVSTAPGWWSDHRVPQGPSRLVPETLAHDRGSLPTASWILDFIVSPQNTRLPTYGQDLTPPRLIAVLSILVFLFLTAFGLVLPDIYPSAIIINPPFLIALALSLAGVFCFLVDLNLVALGGRYINAPAVIEKTSLAKRERKLSEPITRLEDSVRKSEKKKAILQAEENKRRQDFDNALRRLQKQEDSEVQKVKLELDTSITSIESRGRTVDQEERDAMAKMAASTGGRISSLSQQIAAISRTEAEEFARDLDFMQRAYITTFLKGYQVSDAPIPGQRHGSREKLEATLRRYGIRTAYDVSYARVDAVPGFGPVRTGLIVSWRDRLEQKARANMPRDLAPIAKNTVRAKYDALRKSLESQRDSEQAKYAVEESTIRNHRKAALHVLDTERSAEQVKADEKISSVHKRFADEYETLGQSRTQLAAEYSGKRNAIEDQVKRAYEEMFKVSWQLADVRHAYLAYRNVSFSDFVKVVFLGYRAK